MTAVSVAAAAVGMHWRADAPALHAAVQGHARQAAVARHRGDVPVGGAQLCLQLRGLGGPRGEVALLLARGGRRQALCPEMPCLGVLGQVVGQVVQLDALGPAHRTRVVDDVAQLTQVARPAVPVQQGQHLGRHGRGLLAGREALGQQALDQPVEVGPFAQRRQLHMGAIQPVVEVVAEAALAHQLVELAMGGSDHPQVDRHRSRGPDGQHLALGQHPQQPGLQGPRHVADLVEEEGAAVRLLDQPALALVEGTREAPRQVAEQFAFDQGFGDGRTVHRNERLATALAALVQGLGKKLLAAAGFAGEQHVDGGVDQAGGAFDLPVQGRVAPRQGGQRGGQGALATHLAGARSQRAQRRG